MSSLGSSVFQSLYRDLSTGENRLGRSLRVFAYHMFEKYSAIWDCGIFCVYIFLCRSGLNPHSGSNLIDNTYKHYRTRLACPI